MTYSSTILADTPIDYWRFNETSGTSAADSGSGAHAATHNANVTVGAGGRDAAGASYNGTSASTSAASVADFMTGSFSVELWVKYSTITGDYSNFIRRDGSSTAWLIRTRNTTVGRAYIIECYHNGMTLDTGAVTFNDNNWHHVVYTWNGTTPTLYVDGTAYTTSKTGTVAAGGTGLTPLYIGTANGTSDYFKGNLDEVAIYNTALTSAKVTAHYNAAPVPNVTVTPPVFAMNPLTMVAPAFAGPGDKTVTPLVANLSSLSMPAPVVTANRQVTAVVPAMTLSMDTSAPSTPGTYLVSYADASEDRSVIQSGTTHTVTDPNYNRSAATIPFASTSANNQVGFKFGAPPEGYTVTKAVAKIPYTGTISVSAQIQIYLLRLTGDWTEAGTELVVIDASASAIATTSGGVITADITGFVNSGLGHGLMLTGSATGGNSFSVNVYAHESSTSKPQIAYYLAPATIVQPPAMTAALETAAPVVTTTSVISDSISVPPMTATLAFTGGVPVNPDYNAIATAMTIGLDSPDATQRIEYPSVTTVPAMGLALETESGVTINLTTNRLTVAPAMNLNLRMVGIYSQDGDPYLAMLTAGLQPTDTWYKLTETSGSIAADSTGSGTSNTPGTYHLAGPLFPQVDGPQLRKAVHFNGTTDYLGVDYTTSGVNSNDGFALTIEFSLRTTQKSGVLLTTIYPGNAIVLDNGQLVIRDSNSGGLGGLGTASESVRVRKNIADGEWHHVVISIPNQSNYNGGNFDDNTPAHVTIDGIPALVRYNMFLSDSGNGGQWIPRSVMAYDGSTVDAGVGGVGIRHDGTPSGFVAGDLSNFVVRMDSYVTRDQATNLYYAWSESLVVHPEPMTLAVELEAPFKVKGNVKTMIALYGLPWNYEDNDNGMPLYTYVSMLSGMIIDNFGYGTGDFSHSSAGPTPNYPVPVPYYFKPRPFVLDEYIVYPVSIVGGSKGFNPSFPTSVDGLVNSDTEVDQIGRFVDDATGLPRYIDLQEDLAIDITDVDVLTVVNYPASRPFQRGATLHEDEGVQWADPEPVQFANSLSDTEWTAARDRFRDSILQAAYDGVNLWIGEWHAAQHLGFIGSVDIHTPHMLEFDAIGGPNIAAKILDNQHLVHTGEDTAYFSWPQVLVNRRITALIPGLTDIPSNEYGPAVEGFSPNDYMPYGSFYAYNIMRRENGLQIGDLTRMEAMYINSKFYGYGGRHNSFVQERRGVIISARPDGIAGTVVAREQETYYLPDGTVAVNEYKDNAITIAAEVGTVVRGQAIAGRAFIELMDTSIGIGYLQEDANKLLWNGSPVTESQAHSTWDYDSRRAYELSTQTPGITRYQVNYKTGSIDQITVIAYYFQYTDTDKIYNLHVPMPSRGLNWLGQTPTIQPGEARVFANAMTLTLRAAPAPVVTQTKSPTVEVNGAMTLFMELRQPANYRDGNVEEIALAMSMSLEMRGLGKTVQVPPMSLNLTLVTPTLDVAVDLVTVYFDDGNNITVFLKEDN